MVKECSKGFLFIAVIQGIIGYFINPGAIFDALLCIILALILLKWNSRFAAVLLFILAIATLVVTVLNSLDLTGQGGTNIILSIIVVIIAIRSIEATFKLHGKFVQ